MAVLTIPLAFVIVGILMLLVEASSPGFFIAVPGTILIVLGIFGLLFPDLFGTIWSPIIAVVVGSVASVGTIYFYKKIAEPGLSSSTTSADTLVGKTGTVTQKITPGSLKGKVRIESQVWSATADEEIDEGTTVNVISSEGVHVIVKEA